MALKGALMVSTHPWTFTPWSWPKPSGKLPSDRFPHLSQADSWPAGSKSVSGGADVIRTLAFRECFWPSPSKSGELQWWRPSPCSKPGTGKGISMHFAKRNNHEWFWTVSVQRIYLYITNSIICMTKKQRWGKFAQQNTNLSGSANQRFWVTTSPCWFIVLQLPLDSSASRKRLSDRTRFSASRVRSSCEAASGSTRPCGNSFFTKFDYAKFDMCCKHQIQLRSLTMCHVRRQSQCHCMPLCIDTVLCMVI